MRIGPPGVPTASASPRHGELAPGLEVEGLVLLVHDPGDALVEQRERTPGRGHVDRQVGAIQHEDARVQHGPPRPVTVPEGPAGHQSNLSARDGRFDVALVAGEQRARVEQHAVARDAADDRHARRARRRARERARRRPAPESATASCSAARSRAASRRRPERASPRAPRRRPPGAALQSSSASARGARRHRLGAARAACAASAARARAPAEEQAQGRVERRERELVEPQRAGERAACAASGPARPRAEHDAGLRARRAACRRRSRPDRRRSRAAPARRTRPGARRARRSTSVPLPRSSTTRDAVRRARAPTSSARSTSATKPRSSKLRAVHLEDARPCAGRARPRSRAGGCGWWCRPRPGSRPAVAQDLGHAERAADLDQLAARDDHLAAARERREREQHRGGVVVDGERVLGAREQAQQLCDRRRRARRARRSRDRARGRCSAAAASATARRRPRAAARRGRGWCAARRPSRSRPGSGGAGPSSARAPRGRPRPDRAPAAPRSSAAARRGERARAPPRASVQGGSSGRASASAADQPVDGRQLAARIVRSAHDPSRKPIWLPALIARLRLSIVTRSRMFRDILLSVRPWTPQGFAPGSLPERARVRGPSDRSEG